MQKLLTFLLQKILANLILCVSEDLMSSRLMTLLTLKAPITTAADDIPKYFFIVFQKK